MKRKISPTQTNSIFGKSFKSSNKYAAEVVQFIKENNIVDSNGTIQQQKYPMIDKSKLWGYIHHIIFKNKEMFNVKSSISFRSDVSKMASKFLKSIIDAKNIHKYVNHNDKLTYLTKSHLIMFTHSLLIHNPPVKQSIINEGHIDKLIDDEESKFYQIVSKIEKSIESPKVKLINNEDQPYIKDTTLTLSKK